MGLLFLPDAWQYEANKASCDSKSNREVVEYKYIKANTDNDVIFDPAHGCHIPCGNCDQYELLEVSVNDYTEDEVIPYWNMTAVILKVNLLEHFICESSLLIWLACHDPSSFFLYVDTSVITPDQLQF